MLMIAMHIDIHQRERQYLYQREKVGHIEQTSDIDGDGPHIECEHVGILHQREGTLAEVGTQIVRNQRGIRITLPDMGIELLEGWRAALLTDAVVAVEIEIEPGEPILPAQGLEPGSLRCRIVKLTATLAQEEEEMNLPVIVRQRALGRMAEHTGYQTDGKAGVS